MRIIALVTFSDIHKILEYIGVAPRAPCITPARGPCCGMTVLRELTEAGFGLWGRAASLIPQTGQITC